MTCVCDACVQLQSDEHEQQELEHDILADEKHVEGEEGFAPFFPAFFSRHAPHAGFCSGRRQAL